MSEPEKTSVRLKVDDVRNIPGIVDSYLNGSNPPDLVLLQLDSEKFPRRTMDFPKDVRKYVMTHPMVKVEWNQNSPIVQEAKRCFIKIIIPNYNNKMYIRRCLDSILEQSFQDFHIIVVDDLSTDGSDQICEEYMTKFPQKVTFIRANTKGHEGGCRNIGMEYPNVYSEYTYFVDGDDELYCKDALKMMYESAKNKEYDIILVGIVQKDFSTGKLTFNKTRIFDQTSKEMLLSQWNSASAKLVRTSFEVPFLACCDHGADVYQFTKLLDKTPKIKQTDDNVYLYKRNPNSLTMNPNNTRYKDDVFLFYKELLKLMYSSKNPKVREAIEYRVNLWNNGLIKN